jgi:hypothetical protein
MSIEDALIRVLQFNWLERQQAVWAFLPAERNTVRSHQDLGDMEAMARFPRFQA